MSQHNKWLELLGRAGLKTVRFDVGAGGGKRPLQAEDMVLGLCGLAAEPAAWGMYAYVNTDDEQSLNFVTGRLAKIVARKYPNIPTRAVVGLVKITLREHLMYAPGDHCRKGFSVTARCVAMKVSRQTYYRHREDVDGAIELVLRVVWGWEEQIAVRIQSRVSGM